MKKILCAVVVFLALQVLMVAHATPSFAAMDWVEVTVLETNYANNKVWVKVQFSNSATRELYLWHATNGLVNHPDKKEIYATLLTALASGRKVKLYANLVSGIPANNSGFQYLILK